LKSKLKHAGVIGRSMTFQPPVFSPISVLPPTSSHCDFFPAWKKLGAILKNVVISAFSLVYIFVP
jgi:hypothetical protein